MQRNAYAYIQTCTYTYTRIYICINMCAYMQLHSVRVEGIMKKPAQLFMDFVAAVAYKDDYDSCLKACTRASLQPAEALKDGALLQAMMEINAANNAEKGLTINEQIDE